MASSNEIAGEMQHGFAEDPLLVLERVRRYAHDGKRIPEDELAAMRATAGALRECPSPQVFRILEQILVGPFAGQAVAACQDVLGAVVPELTPMAGCPQNTPYHIYDVLGHTAGVIDASPATPLSRWAALFHDCGKPMCRRVDSMGRDHFKGHASCGVKIAQSALERLKAPESLREDVCILVYLHEWFPPETDEWVRKAIRELGGRVDLYRALLALQVADACAKAPDATERGDTARRFQARLERLLAQGSPIR